MDRGSFIIFYYNQHMHNNLTKAHITTVSLCNSHSYVFQQCRIIIRDALPSYLLQIAAIDNIIIKLKCFIQSYISSQIIFVEITIFKIIIMLKHCPFYSKLE